MITADQIACHLVGDYFLQSDWMATGKVKNIGVALIHGTAYSLPFLFLHPSLAAMAVMIVTHALIDRYRLAKHISWAKNWISPVRPKTWEECKATGYDPDKPVWLTTWLMIITDNAMHILINGAALKYLV